MTLKKTYLGYGSIKNLGEILKYCQPKNIFLVTGKKSYQVSGARDLLNPFLKGRGLVHFDDFSINPKFTDIEKGRKIFLDKGCDMVIVVGGGSSLDIAKTINILSSNKGKISEYISKEKKIQNRGAPLVAIPTTSGSGSEATKFAAIYDEKKKCSLEHEYMIPDYVIVDAQLTMNLPPTITAYTGMDAFCQGIESFWSINSTEESKQYSKKVIGLVLENLREAVKNPNKENREAMAEAAFLSGKAINIAKTTACHAISYPITSYFGVPHGHAVSLTVGAMLKYNSKVTESDALDKRGTSYVRQIIGEIVELFDLRSVEEVGDKIHALMENIGLSIKLSDLKIKTENIEVIIKNGFNPDRVKNNPRKLTKKRLRSILTDLM